MESTRTHWDAIFTATIDKKLGWYENTVEPTMRLLSRIPGWQASTLFLPGAGTSSLVDTLYASGSHLVVNDISAQALQLLQSRLKDKTRRIDYLCQDIAQPVSAALPTVQIWVDRAVLHFLNEPAAIRGYVRNLQSILSKDGYVIFAEFAQSGARQCAGLPVHRYSIDALSALLGEEFSLMAHFEHTYINPDGGERPYVYALYRRVDK